MFHQLGTELLLAQSTEPGFAKVMSDRYKLDEAWFHELHGERTPWAQIPHVPRVQTPPVRSVYKMRTRELAAEILQRMKRRARRTITRKK